jgi:hypothetical protein
MVEQTPLMHQIFDALDLAYETVTTDPAFSHLGLDSEEMGTIIDDIVISKFPEHLKDVVAVLLK